MVINKLVNDGVKEIRILKWQNLWDTLEAILKKKVCGLEGWGSPGN